MKKSIAHIAQIIVGMVFAVSAFAKAWGGNAFANLVIQYGADWLSVFVPILIAIESCLASMLLLRVATRKASLFSAIFIVGISLVYLYGVLVKEITDCGCFGVLRALNLPPVGTFIRNFLLIVLCVLGFVWDNNLSCHPWWKVFLMMLFVSGSLFVCGLDMSKSFRLPKITALHQRTHLTVADSDLSEILPIAKDSSYAVYIFSYSCVFCQNSFANVEQYLRIEEIDKVYGIAIEDSVAEARFKRIYQPSIPIYNIPSSTMKNLVAELPVLLLIQKGEIVHIEVGSVLSPGITAQ